jgi:polyhydroxyalkanoate synthesis regulator protein
MKKTELVKLAHEAANAYIDAQKKLLDVAGQQMNVNLQAMDRAITGITPFRLPIANITGEGVKSFVDAEKALIDQMMKRTTPKPKATTAKKAARPRKVAVQAHAATA